MKNILIISCLTALLICISCDDVLDKKPLDTITDADLWNDAALINKYLLQCYSEINFYNEMGYGVNHDGFANANPFVATGLSDEATSSWIPTGKPWEINSVFGSVMDYSWWGYATIRRLNILIEKLNSNLPLTSEIKLKMLGEAKFLRAFAYFNMVKRYGGVPLIVNAQNETDPEEELYPARAKEKDVYDFILSELDQVLTSNALSKVISAGSAGKPTYYAVLALKSRVALYAGSIAKYGLHNKKLYNEGVVGIPEAAANEYYLQSYNASKEIIEESGLSLFKKYIDGTKAGYTKNYQYIFLEENNSEVIFSEVFNGKTTRGHSWDKWQTPNGYDEWTGGQQNSVYLEMVESYENTDGSYQKLPLSNNDNDLYTLTEIFGKKDPRFAASIYTQGTIYNNNGIPVELNYRYAVKENGVWLQDGSLQNGTQVIGVGQRTPRPTPFGILKYLAPTGKVYSRFDSETDWIVFRLGETYLNLAEAAFELGGKQTEVDDAVNAIRNRVGMSSLSNVTLAQIKQERKIELAFEGNRYFDLRRWNDAVKALTPASGTTGGWHGYRFAYDLDKDKYKVEKISNVTGTPTPYFIDAFYYMPILQSRINQNKNLIQNPGY
jgi:starch-binding outer membrane protein, SusD/RagB family